MPRPAGCGPHAAQTLAASQKARVYQLGGEVYGCALGSPHSYRLGAAARTIREGRAGPVAVAGGYAGYGLTRFGIDTVSSQVVVRNLGNGRELHDTPAITSLLPESFQSVDAIVLKSDGAVAWISAVESVISTRGHQIEVLRIDDRGQATLDSGSGIESGSLRLHGSTVAWRDGSVTRTATLY
jgi:hypothetical protein